MPFVGLEIDRFVLLQGNRLVTLVESQITFGSQIAAAGLAGFNRSVKQAPAQAAFDPVANFGLHGARQTASGLLLGQVQAPSAASGLLQTLQRFASAGKRGHSRRTGY